jgi:predicted nucleic acid-binding protein
MTDKTFVIRFKQPGPSTQLVIAARAETNGDQLVLLDTRGKPIARFPAEAIESWTEGPI